MADSELASELYAINIENWFAISMDALSIFEFVTTLDQESSSVWKRKRSGASILLFAVRYTMLATAIVDLCLWARLNSQGCAGVSISEEILELIGFTLTAVFSALRVYALCGGSVKLFTVVLLLQLFPVVANLYGYINSTHDVDPTFGCGSVAEYSSKTSDALTYASRIPLAVGDTLVVLITWIKSSQQLRAHRSLGMHLPLSTLLFRDGTMYFLILLALNILELCPLTATDSGYVIGGLSATLPLILVNRFMLNLSQASDSEGDSDLPEYTQTISMPIFKASVDVVGNMGESLDHGWETSESEEGEKVL